MDSLVRRDGTECATSSASKSQLVNSTSLICPTVTASGLRSASRRGTQRPSRPGRPHIDVAAVAVVAMMV